MPANVKRFVISHINDKDGMRRLTFAKQGRDTYPSREEAAAALVAFQGPNGLARVLSPTEVTTLRVDEVDCYHHHDPVSYYIQETTT